MKDRRILFLSGALASLILGLALFFSGNFIVNNVNYNAFLVFSFYDGVFNYLGFIMILVYVGAITLLALSYKFKQLYSYAVGLILLATLVGFTVPSLFASLYGIDAPSYDALTISGLVFIFLSIGVLLPLLFDEHRFDTKDIVEMAMLVSLAVVLDLSFLKFRVQADGGSISFEMIPLIVLSLRFGVYKGFIGCGVVYGLVSCLMGGYGLQYYIFDYLLAFGSLSIVGFFRPLILKKNHDTKYNVLGATFLGVSILAACTLKYLCHVIAGVLYWETPWVASFIYSATYVPISCVLTIVVCLLLYKPILMIDKLYPKRTLIS